MGRTLQQARSRAGLTVALLAAMMRVLPDQVALAEMGKRCLRPFQLILAANALRVPVEDFYEGLGSTLRSAAEENLGLRPFH